MPEAAGGPLRGAFYDGTQAAYLTPGCIGHGMAGDLHTWHAAVGGEMYPAPKTAPNAYRAAATGMLGAQQLHPTTFCTAEYVPPGAPAGVSADEVTALLAGIDQLESRVAALESKRPAKKIPKAGSASSEQPFTVSIKPGPSGRFSLNITARGSEPSAYPAPAAVLKKLGPIKALLWDMDGVLADVSKSYRTAIIQAAKKFGITVTGADISAAKAAGNANNDWVLTRRLVADKMAAQGKKPSQVPSLEAVTEAFEAVYQGGLWKTESLIVDRKLIAALAARYPMAIVTGRPRKPDAERFLEHYNLTEFFSHMVCMGETPKPKPDPAPCTVMLKALGVPAGSNVIMIGDTVDDIRSAVSAKCTGLGVPAPGHDVAEDTKLFHSVGAATVLSQGLPELQVLVDGVAAKPVAASGGNPYPWSVNIQAKAGAKRPWTVRIVPNVGGASRNVGGSVTRAPTSAAGSDADRLAALLAGIEECEQRLKNLEKNPPKQQAGSASAGGITNNNPAPPGFFPTDMHWLRFGGQAGSAGFTTDATYTPPAPAAPAPEPEPAVVEAPKTKKKPAAATAPKQKQEKKKKREWTDEEKAAARAKAAGGADAKGKAKGTKAAAKTEKVTTEPASAAADDAPAAEPAVASGADTVPNVEGYYYAGYGIWALRPGASASVPSVLPAPRPAVPALPLRDGRGGPKAEPAAAANEYVAIETQEKAGKSAGKPAPAPQKQKQTQKPKQKEQLKKAVGEPVEEMSDADMLKQLQTGGSSSAPVASPAAEEPTGDAAFANSEKHLTPAPLGRDGPVEYPEPGLVNNEYRAADKGMLTDLPANTCNSEDWVIVGKGDGEIKSPLPMLEKFKEECLSIICKFVTDRGHRVPEVRIEWAERTCLRGINALPAGINALSDAL